MISEGVDLVQLGMVCRIKGRLMELRSELVKK